MTPASPGVTVDGDLLLLSLVLFPAGARAQTAQQVQPEQRSELQRRLESEIMCTCGCRRPLNNCGMMNCEGHDSQRAKIVRHIADGKDHDAIIAAFVTEFGSQDVLAAPIDEGFNRLAWLFPYVVGILGLVTIAIVARRWSHTTPAYAGAADGGMDSGLNERLDDELRDLD